MKMVMNYQEAALSRRAKKLGLLLEKGFQQYMGPGRNYITDDHGNRIIGYQLFDTETGNYVFGSYENTRTHCLTTLDEVLQMIAEVARDKDVLWY